MMAGALVAHLTAGDVMVIADRTTLRVRRSPNNAASIPRRGYDRA